MKPSAEEAAIIRICWYNYGHLLTPISRFPDGANNRNLAACIQQVSLQTVFHQTILRVLETYGDDTMPLHEYMNEEDVEEQSKAYLEGGQR